MRYLLGIDAGTTSFKGILYDETGNIISKATSDYVLITPSADIVEFDPEEYWIIFKTIVNKILSDAKIDIRDIKALSIDSQGETLICLDNRGQPLRNAIVWLDNRSNEEAKLIEKHFTSSRVYQVTGQPEIAATWPATKILWLRRNEPELFSITDKFLLLEDYLIYKLTGRFITEKSLISSTIYFDIHNNSWWKEMLDFIGIAGNQLPEIRESGEKIGPLTSVAAGQTGLGSETIVVTGALDQAAGMLGAGNVTTGIVTETTGACFAMCINVDPTDLKALDIKVPIHYHALRNKYYLIFWSPTAGLVLKWFKNNLYVLNNGTLPDADIFKTMDAEAGDIAPGSEGLLTLPYMSGTGFPEYNPLAKGVFCGFTLGHARGHFIRSILESIAYLLRNNVEILEGSGIIVNEIRAMGGGAKSQLWNSIKADVTSKKISVLKDDETACLGAAILAGVGAGIFETIEDACDSLVCVKKSFIPDDTKSKTYEDSYKSYLELYKSMESMFKNYYSK